MMKKIFLLFMVSGVFSLSSSAQNVKQKIEKQATDPKTKENAARADKHIINDKKISENSTTDVKTSTAAKHRSSKQARKKKCS